MNLSINETITIFRFLVALSLFFQNIEYIILKPITIDNGLWNFKFFKDDFKRLPPSIFKILSICLSDHFYISILLIRLFSGLILFFCFSSVAAIFLFLTTLLLSIRFRGSFNGGSDYMSLILCMSLILICIFLNHPIIVKGTLWYITLQVTFSYFYAGLVKLKNPNWYNGKAIQTFLSSIHYNPPKIIVTLLSKNQIAKPISILILIFECTFPIIFISKKLAIIYIVSAFLFHLSNYLLFGLNRFLWIWSSSYICLYYCLVI
jgi:hypothetical protein